MKYFCVVGNPIAHSISPKLHNLGYKLLNIDCAYSRMLLENGDDLKKNLLKCKYDGANITAPYKEIAFNICDEVFGIAQKIKAVNTIIIKNDKLYGYNTDAPGFLKSIEEFKNIKNVLILGAGGTAKAISFALREQNFNVSLLNRSKERLEFFKNENFTTFTYDSDLPYNFDLIVNTTSAGLDNEQLPAPKEMLLKVIGNAKYGVDVIYNNQTAFLKLFMKSDKAYKNGSDMLFFQGILAFEHFTNTKLNDNNIIQIRQLLGF